MGGRSGREAAVKFERLLVLDQRGHLHRDRRLGDDFDVHVDVFVAVLVRFRRGGVRVDRDGFRKVRLGVVVVVVALRLGGHERVPEAVLEVHLLAHQPRQDVHKVGPVVLLVDADVDELAPWLGFERADAKGHQDTRKYGLHDVP